MLRLCDDPRANRNPTISHEIRLASRPRGRPALRHFALARTELPPIRDGQMLVRNLYMSLDSYMKARMSDAPSRIPPFRLGEPLEGSAIGEVVASRSDGFSPGDVVTSMQGWREYFLTEAGGVHRVDRSIQPLSAYLGPLGTAGLTAWVGLNLVGGLAKDRVFVSAAAGAVGSVAGQLAKLRGCYVVGSAGSREEVAMLVGELGFDAAFDCTQGSLRKQLHAAAPQGVDVYFDNMGGAHLEAALAVMRPQGRVVACDAVPHYDQFAEPARSFGVRNLSLVISKRLTIRGFVVSDWLYQVPTFIRDVGGYLRDGRLHTNETVIDGIERAPQALIDLVRGHTTGNVIVRLA